MRIKQIVKLRFREQKDLDFLVRMAQNLRMSLDQYTMEALVRYTQALVEQARAANAKEQLENGSTTDVTGTVADASSKTTNSAEVVNP